MVDRGSFYYAGAMVGEGIWAVFRGLLRCTS